MSRHTIYAECENCQTTTLAPLTATHCDWCGCPLDALTYHRRSQQSLHVALLATSLLLHESKTPQTREHHQ